MANAGDASMRKDAQRNREAILGAARELFAESGAVPMYEIARRAGVGQATLYRHFPDRGAVAAVLAAEILVDLERIASENAGDPDAFFVMLRGLVSAQARCNLFHVVREDPVPESELEPLRQRFIDLFRPPLRDAKAAGTLRRDLTMDDVLLLVAMVNGAMEDTAKPAERVARAMRALELTLHGLTTPSGAA
jgi:AcrR family transcriptional regulator